MEAEDAVKIREAEEQLLCRFEALSSHFGEAIRRAIKRHNAHESRHGFPPATDDEMSTALTEAVSCAGLDLDLLIKNLRDLKLFEESDDTNDYPLLKNFPPEKVRHLMDRDTSKCKCCAPDGEANPKPKIKRARPAGDGNTN
jgi:hypothetical protein